MTTDRRDWDRDEREALEGLEGQVDVMRRRHAGDPPFDLLRAAHGDALPGDLQAAVSEHIAANPMARTLAEGIGDAAPELSTEEQERLLARIMREARAESVPARGAWWLRPALAGVGLVAIASLVWIVSQQTQVGSRSAPVEVTVADARPSAPPFVLPFDKPDVRLGLNALTWRGSTPATGSGNQLLSDLKPGLDAYRNGDYAAADRELSALALRYPGTVEILFYQGVSRLFLNDLPGAIAALDAAATIGDRTFAADISWYRTVAEQHAGRAAGASRQLEALCNKGGGGGDARACVALEQLAQAPAPPQ